MLLVGMCNYFAVIFFPSWRTILWWNIWNGLILIAAWPGNRSRDSGGIGSTLSVAPLPETPVPLRS